MKIPYIPIYLLAIASIGHSQQTNNLSTVSMSNPPGITAGSIPNTCGYSYDYTESAISSWTLWCPGGISIRGGTVQGTGNGACPTGLGILSPCAAPNGSPAPTFSAGPATLNSGVWTMPLNIGNAGRIPVSVAGTPPLAYVCGNRNVTQATTTTNNVTCPTPTCRPGQPGCGVSPILIDPTGEGFFLTTKDQGVEFREESTSSLTQMAWTDPAHHNAWLVRPNADGTVTSLAGNMFGNLSPQSPSDTPNGYGALAYFAAQEGCGKISWLDSTSCAAAWQQLMLWHDANQDGIAQPGELQTLEAAGVTGISLEYHEQDYIDQYGNQFRYESKIRDAAGHDADRCYDVFLVF